MSAPVDTTAQATSQVPPQHPSSASGASVNPNTNPEVNATATGPAIAGNAGQPTAGGGGGLQDKIKGVFGMIHGSGEAIRGTTNSTLDQIGEAIAGRSATSTSGNTDPAPPTRSEGGTGRTPADVAGAGSDEFKAGLGAFRRN